MAAPTSNPTGFSYAQAARGQKSATTSQTPSSKVTSGAATPANSTLSEVTTGSNWAESVDASVSEKTHDNLKADSETLQAQDTKDILAKVIDGASSDLSPEPAAMASSHPREDDSSPAPIGSASESMREIKPQVSEPAWIMERKERQNASPVSEATTKGDKDAAEPAAVAPAKPVVLQESAPPVVNPWLKRAEENKAKLAALPKMSPTSNTTDSNFGKQNQRPRVDTRRKDEQISENGTIATAVESKRTGGPPVKRGPDPRSGPQRSTGRAPPSSDQATAPASRTHGNERLHTSTPLAAPPPSVKDEALWPTPNLVPEKERKDSADKDAVEDKHDEDINPSTKRKKQEWKVIPVVPNVIWETPSMNEKDRRVRGLGSERAGRGGTRGRGGLRGGPNGVHGNDRNVPKITSGPSQEQDSQASGRGHSAAADRDAMPPPPKPARATSANAYRDQNGDNTTDRKAHNAFEDRRGSDVRKNESSFSKSFSEARRARSPKTVDPVTAETKGEDQIPKPIPRRNSLDTTADGTEVAKNTARENSWAPRVPAVDGRKDTRSFDAARDSSWSGPPRGGKRGGRGRGGNGNGARTGDLANGHPGANGFGNNHSADFSGSPYGGVPPSPSMFNGPRGNHQYGFTPPPPRGGWARGNPRSQSIPVENFYSRYSPAYGGPAGLPPIQTYVPGMYEYGGYPVSAMTYNPLMDQQWLLNEVMRQVEYYFSFDNLLKDTFLRKNMDDQGYVFLDIIAAFPRIRNLSQDRDILRTSCMNSDQVDICIGEDGKERLRRRDMPANLVLDQSLRDESVQNSVPQQLRPIERPQLFAPSPSPFHGPVSAGMSPSQYRGDRNASFPSMNGFPAPYPFSNIPDGMYGDFVNGEETRGRPAKSPLHGPTLSASHHLSVTAAEERDVEPDAFPDEQANVLTVLVKVTDLKHPPFHTAASRTFSNGSIDSKSILSETEKSSESQQSEGDATVNGSDRLSSLSRHTSPNKSQSMERGPASPEMQLFWVKDQDVPVDRLLSGLTSEPYVQLRFKALDQRDHAATGTCPYDLDVLYQFWCHFLLRNFNNRMYSEFKYYANQDAKERHNLNGLQNLIKFYSQALNSYQPIRERVVKDYVALVKNEPAQLDGSAFKGLRSAWRNGALNLKNRKKLNDVLDEEIKAQLDRTET